jgi:hypothetical protein
MAFRRVGNIRRGEDLLEPDDIGYRLGRLSKTAEKLACTPPVRGDAILIGGGRSA